MAGNRVLYEDVSAVAFSKAKQTNLETAQTLGLAFEMERSIVTNIKALYKQLDNRGSLSGSREPDRFWQGSIAPFELQCLWPKASANDFGFVFGFGSGGASAASQIGTTGVYHNGGNTMPDTSYALPMTTVCGRIGDEVEGMSKVLLYGLQAKSFGFSWDNKDENIKLNMTLQVPGKFKRNIKRQVVKASNQATSITLVGDAVHDAPTPAASTRLNAVHSILADRYGDGRSWKNVNFTAVSDATPAVITAIASLNLFDQVYKVVSNALTNYSDGSSSMVLNLSTANKLYLGSYEKFNAVDWTITVPNDAVQTLTYKYFKSDGTFTAVSDFVDDTVAGGVTLATTGKTAWWNMPTDWLPCMLPPGGQGVGDIKKRDMYWIEISATGTLLATTAATCKLSRYEVAQGVKFCDNGVYTDYDTEASSAAGSEFPAVQITTLQDYVYFRALRSSCGRIYIKIGSTPNAVAATTMTIEYYNGAWGTVAGLSDGTVSGGISMAQHGACTFTQPTDHQLVTIDSDEGKWFRISWDKTLTAGAYIQMLRVGDRYVNHEITYRCKESVDFTEGQASAWPSEVVEHAFTNSGVALFLGARFDSTDVDFSGGYQLSCEQQSGEYNFDRGSSAPEPCLDGTLTPYAQQHNLGNPTQTLKIKLKTDKATYELLNNYEDRNMNNVHLETVKELSVGIRITGTQILEANSYLRYRFMMVLPLIAFNVSGVAFGDNKYNVSLDLSCGQNTTDNLKSMYYKAINEESTGYAQ